MALTIIVPDCFDIDGWTESDGWPEAVGGRRTTSVHGRSRIECMQRREVRGGGEGARVDILIALNYLSRS